MKKRVFLTRQMKSEVLLMINSWYFLEKFCSWPVKCSGLTGILVNSAGKSAILAGKMKELAGNPYEPYTAWPNGRVILLKLRGSG